MRPPRFRLRTLMVAVAAVAAVLGSLHILKVRRDRFEALLELHFAQIRFTSDGTEVGARRLTAWNEWQVLQSVP